MSLPILSDPSPEEEAVLRRDAVSASGCTDWLHHCDAACCSQFSLVDKEYDLTQKMIRVYGMTSPSMIRYYELHRCTYRHPYLYIPTRKAVRKDGRIYILEKCKYLKDRKCIAHGTNRQPAVCREFTLPAYLAGTHPPGSMAISRCLFRFKKELQENGGE